MPVLSQLITADIWCKTWAQQPLGQVFFWDSPSHLGVSLNLPSLLTDNRFCLLCLKFKAMSLLWLLSSACKRFIVPALNARMFLFRYLTQFLAPPVTQLKPVFVITICFLQRRCSTASGPFSLFLLSSYLHQKSELFSLQLLIFPSSTPLKFFFFFFPLIYYWHVSSLHCLLISTLGTLTVALGQASPYTMESLGVAASSHFQHHCTEERKKGPTYRFRQ